jgi:hypothetical protein
MAAVVTVSPFAGERFVGLVTEDVAQVGDRGVELSNRCGEGTGGEPGHGGRRFEASEAVEKDGEDREAAAHPGWCCPRRGSCGSPA